MKESLLVSISGFKLQLHKFKLLPTGDRVLLFHTIFLVGIVRIGLWVASLRLLRRMLSRSAHRASQLEAPAERLAWAVTVGGRLFPKTSCLVQSLVLQHLLTRAGHEATVRIGVSKESDFEAHAWVECDKQVFLGGAAPERYTPILALEPDR
jgi:hypothetical protein